MNKAPDLAEREPPVAATESLVTPQNGQPLAPASSPPRQPRRSTPVPPSEAAILVAAHRIAAGRGAACDSAVRSCFAQFFS